MRGCAVSRRYINICNCDMFSVVYVYLDHLKFCVVCIDVRRYVRCSECDVVSNECDEPTSCLVQHIGTHCCEMMYFGCVGFRGDLDFLNCDDVCMCVVNKQFKLFEFVFDSVNCCVCGHVVVFGLSVRLMWYPMWMRLLL